MDKVQVGDLWRGRYAPNLLTVSSKTLALVIDIYDMVMNNKTTQTYVAWQDTKGQKFYWELYHFMEEFQKIS